MPKLDTNRPTKKVQLPSFPDSEVEIYETITVADMFELDRTKTPGEVALDTVARLIKGWNFTGPDDKPILPTKENLKFLPLQDILFLFQQSGLEKLNEELKKNAPAS